MKRLSLFCAFAGLVLGSASLPHARTVESPLLAYAAVDCAPAIVYSCAPVLAAAALAAAPPLEKKTPAPPPPGAAAAVPEEVGDDGVRIVISLPQQKAYVFRDGDLIDTSPVSTGKRGHRTPTGSFPILQKKKHHRSNKYDNAPMPYMQRLTWTGIALHAGHLPGYPASHGCIRLPWGFARKLYRLTDHGTRVTITDERPESAEAALSLA